MSERTLHHHPVDILGFIRRRQARGEAVALIVVTDVTGGAMRRPGDIMAVTASGEPAGYVSNGCVDGDIIGHAKRCLESGETVSLTYGEGSPFRDIVLPCGGSISLLVMPTPEAAMVKAAHESLSARKPTQFSVPDHDFNVTWQPRLRLRIIGSSAAVPALSRQAHAAGFEAEVWSPDTDIETEGTLVHLVDPSQPPAADDDAHTAVVLLFHDHDREPLLIKQATQGPAFYIGAMGSRRSADNRRMILSAMGMSSTEIDRVRGPIGLIPSVRDADLLALSVLSEIVSVAQRAGRL